MIVFDVETSGLDERANGIIGLGAIMLPGGDTFYHEPRLIESLKAHPKALEVNGFTEEEIRSKDRIDMETTLQHFSDWVVKADDMILAGWNSTFDYRFLSAEYMRCGLRWPFKYRVIDIQSLAYTVMRIRDQWTPMHDGVSTVGLNYTLKWLGLPKEPEPHNALTGAQCNVDVLLELTKMIEIVPVIKLDEGDGDNMGPLKQLSLVGPASDPTGLPPQAVATAKANSPAETGEGESTLDNLAYLKWLEGQS